MIQKITTISFICLGFVKGFSQQEVKDSTNVKDIEEVILLAQKKKVFSDHTSYSFDQKVIKSARYAKDLVLSVPQLELDPITNNVKSIKGERLLILINGVESTSLQLQSVKPEMVVRVEHYEIAPTRWANRADSVVNVITKNPNTGYTGGFNVTNSPLTGFLNGSAYFNKTEGRHSFELNYNLNFRDYDNRLVDKTYQYNLNNQSYFSENKEQNHFGYTSQNITLKYSNALQNKYTFQAKVNLELYDYFTIGNGKNLFRQGNILSENTTINRDGEKYISPLLDIYFAKNIGKSDEIILNLVGANFNIKSSEYTKEWVTTTGANVFDNDMNLKANQNHFVAELAHIHIFKIGKLSTGYRLTNENVLNKLNNLYGYSEYRVNYLQQYIYSEFAGKKDKLTYRIGAGLTNINNKSEYEKTKEWTFTPSLILGYTIYKGHTLRFVSSYKPQTPSGSQLSSNIVQIAPNIVKRGNPYLKPEYRWRNQLWYLFNNKYFDFNFVLFYENTKSAINEYFSLDNSNNKYALMYENAYYFQKKGVQMVGTIKPFGNNYLRISGLIAPIWEKMKTNRGTDIKNYYLWNKITLTSQYKNFTLQYKLNFPIYSLNGAFLSTNENENHLFVNYRKNKWTLTAGMYWIGMQPKYTTKSLEESLVNYMSSTQIKNNKNMIVFGVAYDFSKGKNNEIEKKLENGGGQVITF